MVKGKACILDNYHLNNNLDSQQGIFFPPHAHFFCGSFLQIVR